jgi:hypothetical protein
MLGFSGGNFPPIDDDLFFWQIGKISVFFEFSNRQISKNNSKLKFSFIGFFLKFQYVAKNIVRCWISFLNSCSHQFFIFIFQFFDVKIFATLPPKLENLVKIILKKPGFPKFQVGKKRIFALKKSTSSHITKSG